MIRTKGRRFAWNHALAEATPAPRFHPHSRWGASRAPVHVSVPHAGAGCCHLQIGLCVGVFAPARPVDFSQSPELGFSSDRLHKAPSFARALCHLSPPTAYRFLGGARAITPPARSHATVRRPGPSPRACAAARPASGPRRSPLDAFHSCRLGKPDSAPTAAAGYPKPGS
jgi:hypothetical protein